MTQLASEGDLANRLGRQLTDDEAARAYSLISDVSASVQLHTGQQFEQATQTLRARVRQGVVRLTQRPVQSVTSVEDIDGNEIAHEWDGLDRIYITYAYQTTTTFDIARRRPLVVDVVYEAGPSEPPAPIVGVVSAIVLRALGVDPTEGATTQESVDGYAFTIGAIGGAGAFGVLPAEAAILDRYTGVRRIGNIRIAT